MGMLMTEPIDILYSKYSYANPGQKIMPRLTTRLQIALTKLMLKIRKIEGFLQSANLVDASSIRSVSSTFAPAAVSMAFACPR